MFYKINARHLEVVGCLVACRSPREISRIGTPFVVPTHSHITRLIIPRFLLRLLSQSSEP